VKIRNASGLAEELPFRPLREKLSVKNEGAELRRGVKRLRSLLGSYFESAARMGIELGPDAIRAALNALIAEAAGLPPATHLQCPDERRHYLRCTMFDELAGEPSNILYSTRVNADTIRYEAMPHDFWKSCLRTLRDQLER
jgi:hypothetical protein